MLLVEVANAVKDLLPLLDKVTHPMIKFQENDDVVASAANHAAIFQKEIERIVNSAFFKVDHKIRMYHSDNDKSCAAASVVIVTKYNIITAWLGNVRVFNYDEDFRINRLTNDHSTDNVRCYNHYGKRLTNYQLLIDHFHLISPMISPLMIYQCWSCRKKRCAIILKKVSN